MSSLEDRLRRLEDERDIQQTMHQYGYALDYGLEDQWLDCWTENASLTWSSPPFRGQAQLLQAFRTHTHAPDVFHKHFVVNARITVERENAHAESMFARLDAYPDGPKILAMGRYLDTFLRCADGRWRFTERIAEVEAHQSPPDAVLKLMAWTKN